jgi:hypothetical protein
MNNNFNNLYFDYIGATGTHTITDYIDFSSNNNYSYTSNSSNILSNNIRITSNNLIDVDNKYNNLIRSETEGILKHTYITNSNIQGQIRFITRFDNNDYRYKTRIKENGEIEVLYPEYNPIYPTMFVGWYNVMGSIRDAYNYQNIATELIGGSLLAINDLYKKFYGLVAATGASLASITGGQLTPEFFLEATLNASRVYKFNRFNQLQAFLGITGLGVAGITASVMNGVAYDTSVRNILYDLSNLDLNVYSNITSNQKYTALSNLKIDANLNIIETNSNFSNLNILNGFTNSNIITQQYLNAINTNELKLNQTNIFNIFVASNVLSNININQGFLNSNITNQQYISNLKTDNLFLNNGNISNINGISTNELIASGKIKQNNILLDNIYLTSNHLYNLAFNYTAERQYPSKLFTSSSIEGTATLLNKLVYKQILFLDTSSISYGSGFYEIYSSSTFDNGITTKDKLFNFNTSETTNTSRWGISLYNSGTGNYQGDNSIDGSYFGDWVILKLPQEILLTRYRIYQRTDFLTKAPAEWKCYGSKDGITFTEIIEASQTTRLTSYSGGFFEKSLNPTFTTQYQYIGFVFNKLLSTSGQTDLSFAELQIFGKEIISNSIVSKIYTTSNAVKYLVRNEMPDVPKRKMFIISIPSSATFFDSTSSTTYYKYDLDLRNYTTTQIIPSIPITNDLLRIFKISFWYIPSYFGSYINGEPYVVNYTIYMSNKSNPIFGKPETAGINIYAVGFPENTKLSNILPNNLMLLKNYNSNFNYLTIVSRTAPADLYCIIEDQLF